MKMTITVPDRFVQLVEARKVLFAVCPDASEVNAWMKKIADIDSSIASFFSALVEAHKKAGGF